MTDDPTPEEDLVEPYELATFLTTVYRDEEASNFERVQAAVALTTYWMGVQLQAIAIALEQVSAMKATSSGRML